MIIMSTNQEAMPVLAPLEHMLNAILEDEEMKDNKFAKREFAVDIRIINIPGGNPNGGRAIIELKPTIELTENESVSIPFNPNIIHCLLTLTAVFISSDAGSPKRKVEKTHLDQAYRVMLKHLGILNKEVGSKLSSEEDIKHSLGVTYVMNALTTGKIIDDVANYVLELEDEEAKPESPIILANGKTPGISFSEFHSHH